MTEAKSTFLDFKKHEGGKVGFNRVRKYKISSTRFVGMFSHVCIKNNVKGPKYNLLSIINYVTMVYSLI